MKNVDITAKFDFQRECAYCSYGGVIIVKVDGKESLNICIDCAEKLKKALTSEIYNIGEYDELAGM